MMMRVAKSSVRSESETSLIVIGIITLTSGNVKKSFLDDECISGGAIGRRFLWAFKSIMSNDPIARIKTLSEMLGVNT